MSRFSLNLATNVAVAFAGRLVVLSAGLITFGLLARTLGADGLGVYRVVLTILAFAGVTADLGIHAIALREIARSPDDQSRIIGNAVACRLAAVLSVAGVVALVIGLSPYPDEVRLGVAVSALGWIGVQLSALLMAVFQEKLKAQFVALAEVTGALVTLAGVALLAYYDAGVVWMLSATSLGFVVSALFSWRLSQRLVPFRLRFSLATWRGMVLAGLPIAGSTILLMVQIRGDLLVLSLVRPMAEVGIYDVAAKIYEIFTMLPHILSGLLLPLFAKDLTFGHRTTARMEGALVGVAVFMLPVLTAVMFFAEEISTLLAGDEFAASGKPLRLIAMAMLFGGLAHILRFAAIAMDQQVRVMKADLIATSVAVLAYVSLIPSFSYMGAASGRLLSDVTLFGVMLLLLVRFLGVPAILRPLLIVGLATALMALSVASLDYWGVHWLVACIVGGLVYLLAVAVSPGVRDPVLALGREPGAPLPLH